MRLGQWVFFKHEKILKRGFVTGDIGTDELKIMCDGTEYIKKHWEIRKIPDEVKKKILITGHLGMIGSKIFSYLQSTGLYSLKGIDIADNSGDIRTWNEPEKYDIIIHCAALTSVTESIIRPNEYYETNVLGTVNLLNNYRNSKMIFLSSSAIYGEGLDHKEDDLPKPSSPYAQNKIDAEFSIHAISNNYTILRLANVYGGKKKDRGIYQICEEDKCINIFGDGSSLRDYVHVDIVCKAICNCFNKTGVFNIGSGITKTTLAIAKEFNKPINHLPARVGEIKQISLDISKAKNEGII